jgi:hypothetical protein
VTAIASAVPGVIGAIEKFKTGDPMNIASGVLDVVSVGSAIVGTFLGKVGSVFLS